MTDTATDTVADELAGLLRAEADWMEQRAGLLVELLADPSGWRPGAAVTGKRQALRDEAARWRARAMLVRMAVTKAQGA